MLNLAPIKAQIASEPHFCVAMITITVFFLCALTLDRSFLIKSAFLSFSPYPCILDQFLLAEMNRLARSVTPFLLGQLATNKPPGDDFSETLFKDLCKESKLAWHHQASTFNYFSLTFLWILTIHANTFFNATIQEKSINLHDPSLPLSQNKVKMFMQGELLWIF